MCASWEHRVKVTPFEFYLVCDSRKVHVAKIFRIRQMDIGFVMLHAHANDQPLIIIYSVFKQEAGSRPPQFTQVRGAGGGKEKKRKKRKKRIKLGRVRSVAMIV